MKRLISLTLVLFSILMLAPSSVAADTGEGEAITMLFSAGGSGKAISAAAQRFTEETGITANVLLFTLNEVYEKQILSLSGGMDDIDIIAINDPWLPLLQDYLVPLEMDQDFLDKFIPGMLNTFSSDGNIYGIPVRMGGDVVTYRQDVFDAAGVDINNVKTFDDLYQVALSLTDKENGKYGWAMGLVEPSNVVKAWYEFLICYGGSIMNETRDGFSFNTPEGIAATEMFAKFVNDCSPPDVLNYSFNDQIDAMKTGSVSMGLLWTSRYPSVNAADSEYYGQWKVLPWMPGGGDMETDTACVDGWAVGISQSSSHKEAAKEFIKYIGSYDEQLKLAVENSNSPTIASIYEAPEYLAVVHEATNMNSALSVALPRPQEVFFNEVQEELALYVKLACLGDMSVEDALAACEAECMDILEDYQ